MLNRESKGWPVGEEDVYVFTTEVSIVPRTFPFPECSAEECFGKLVQVSNQFKYNYSFKPYFYCYLRTSPHSNINPYITPRIFGATHHLTIITTKAKFWCVLWINSHRNLESGNLHLFKKEKEKVCGNLVIHSAPLEG